MAKGKKTGGRDFRPGNPGRPKGAKDKLPRGLVKSLVLSVIKKANEALVQETLLAALGRPKHAVKILELAAKLNKEIGRQPDQASGRATLHFHSPQRPEKLRGGHPNPSGPVELARSLGGPEGRSLPEPRPVKSVLSAEPVPERVRDYHFGIRRPLWVIADHARRARRYSGER